MSTTVIDNKIVEIELQNKNFESNAKTTINTLEKLQEALDFSNTGRSIDSLNKNLQSVEFDRIADSVDKISEKFSLLGVIGFTALNNITNKLVDTGVAIAENLVIGQKNAGFAEYELKMSSIRTIMEGSQQPIEVVKDKLEELNKYADKTIYSFSDMTRNIGKFTNAGVDLDKSVAAIKGISNLAAISGQNAESASRAMYNIAQSLSAGYVKLIDWKSIENANMATVEFKQQLLDTALAMGTVVKVGDKYQTTTTDLTGKMSQLFTATSLFNESLSHQWITTDVMVKTLNDYASEETEIGVRANKAATEIRSFSIMMDTLREASGSAWAATWEYIFGDLNQATELWTSLGGAIESALNKLSKPRNDVLKDWNEFGGRSSVIEGIKNIFNYISKNVAPIAEAWRRVFPPWPKSWLTDISIKFGTWTSKLKENKELTEAVGQIAEFMFRLLRVGLNTIKAVFASFGAFSPLFKDFGNGITSVIIYLGTLAKKGNQALSKLGYYAKITDVLSIAIGTLVDSLKRLFNIGVAIGSSRPIKNVTNEAQGAAGSLPKLSGNVSTLSSALGTLKSKLISVKSVEFPNLAEKFKNFSIKESVKKAVIGALDALKSIGEKLHNVEIFHNAMDEVKIVMAALVATIFSLNTLVLAAAVGLGYLALSIARLIITFSTVTSRIGQMFTMIGVSFKRMGKGVQNFLNAKAFGELLESLAKMLLIFAISMKLITSTIDKYGWTNAQKSLYILGGVILVALITYFATLRTINKMLDPELKKNNVKALKQSAEILENSTKVLTKVLLASAVAMFIINKSITDLANVTKGTNPDALAAALIFTFMTVAVVIGAAYGMVKEFSEMGNNIAKMQAITNAMYAFSTFMIAMSVGIEMLVHSIITMASYFKNSDSISKSILSVIAAIIVIGGSIFALGLATKKLMDYASKMRFISSSAPSVMMSAAASILILSVAMFAVMAILKRTAKFINGDTTKIASLIAAWAVMSLTLFSLTGAIKMLTSSAIALGKEGKATKSLGHVVKIIKQLGKTISSVLITMTLLMLVMKIGNFDKNITALNKLTSTFVIVSVMLTALIGVAMKLVHAASKTDPTVIESVSNIISAISKSLTSVLKQIAILAVVTKIVGPNTLSAVTATLVMVGVFFGVIFAVLLNFVKNSKAANLNAASSMMEQMGNFISKMVAVLAIMAIVTKLVGPEAMITSMISIGLMLSAAVICLEIANGIKATNGVTKNLKALTGILATIGIVLGIVGLITKTVGIGTMAVAAGLLSGMMLVIVGIMSLLAVVSKIGRMNQAALALNSVVLSLAVLTLAISTMAAVFDNIDANNFIDTFKEIMKWTTILVGIMVLLSVLASIPVIQTGIVVAALAIGFLFATISALALSFGFSVSLIARSISSLIIAFGLFGDAIEDIPTKLNDLLFGLAQQAPSMANSFITIVGAFLTGLLGISNLIGKTFIELFIAAPLRMISNSLPGILKSVKNIVLELVKFIVELAPEIGKGLYQLFLKGLDFLEENGYAIIDRSINFILDFITSMSEALVDNSKKVRETVIQVTHNLINAVLEVLGIDHNGKTAGFINTIIDAIFGSLKFLITMLETGIQKVVDLFTYLVDGFKNGLETLKNNKLFGIIEKVSNFVIDGFKKTFQIHSPSKVMYRLGKYVGEGLIEGFVEEKLPISDALSGIGEFAIGSLKDKFANSSLGQIAADMIGDLKEGFDISNILSGGTDMLSMLGINTDMFSDLTITPQVDLSNVEAASLDASDILNSNATISAGGQSSTMFNQNRKAAAIAASEARNNNKYDDSSMLAYVELMNTRLQEVANRLANTQVVLDNGVLVGEMTSPLDSALGTKLSRNVREKG